jgi:glycosyltransferase involved in cell wall biosynthesis
LQNNGYKADQVYNPIDTEAYHPDPEARKHILEMFHIPEDHKIITWVGRPGWRKRFIHIIEIAARIITKNPKVHLFLHTDMNDPSLGFNPRELLYARGLTKENAVLFPQGINYDHGYPVEFMNQIYNATDVYISPAEEGMGLPQCEAMSCGKPFVATDTTTCQELAGYEGRGTIIGKRGIGINRGNTFIDKGILRPYANLEDFVKQTEWLLENPSECKKMGEAGRLFVQKEVDKRVVGTKLMNIFEKFRVNGVL